MGPERPDVEALDVWFRRRHWEWFRKNQALLSVSLVLMILAVGGCLDLALSAQFNAYAALYFLCYLLVLGPVLALIIFTLVLTHGLPPQDIALPFTPAQMYRAALKYGALYALTALGTLWLLPWVVVCLGEFMSPSFFLVSEYAYLGPQHCAVMLAAVQLQALMVIYYSVTSWRSVYAYMPLLLLLAVNLATLLWMMDLAVSPYYGLISVWLSVTAKGFGILFLALLVRTVIMPRDFRGYWEHG